MCGLAELLLPPPWRPGVSTLPTSVQAGAQHHADGGHIGSHSPHPILDGQAGQAGSTRTASDQDSTPDARPAGAGSQGAQEASSDVTQGTRPGSGPSTDQLPALGAQASLPPPHRIVVNVSDGSRSTLNGILQSAYLLAAGETGEARSILVALQTMQPPAFVGNTADPITEQTAYMEVTPGRTVLYSFENGSTIPAFIANLASFATTVQEAKAWIDESTDIWQHLIDSDGHRVRRDLAVEPNRAEPSGTGPGQVNDTDSERIFVYCDVIQTSPCSDTQTRCMRIISARRDKREFVLFPVYYMPCSQRVIQFVHVELRDKRGDAVNFMPSPHPTVAILHFRRLH